MEPMTEIRRINWEEVAAFLQKHGQDQAGRFAVQIESITTSATWAAEVDHPEAIETLLVHLLQTHRSAGISLEERADLYVQVFRGGFALQEGVILYLPLFADANLERAVRETLGRPQGRLTPEDVASLKNLNFHGKDIHSLAGIEYLTALRRLSLSRNQIVDLTPLKQLNLYWLALDGNQIVDLTPLKQLNNLQELALSRNQIVDLTPLRQLNNLQELALDGNQIVDLTPLRQLNNLQELALRRNQIVDLTPLKQLNNLQWLYLSWNQIVDLAPLRQLNNLQELALSRNQIVDLTPLKQLNNLQELWLWDNQIEDLAPLVANSSLGKGDSVNLQNNPLSNQARNEQIPALQARGVDVRF